MNDIKLRETTSEDTKLATDLITTHWGGEPLLIRAKSYYPSQLDGILALKGSEVLGFLFYETQANVCEIVVFEVFEKFKGIGTRMLEKLKHIAINKNCEKVQLMTTNDNVDALRFYQRRNFQISGIHIDSMKESRKIKPSIPLEGDYGIPLRDEIDLVLRLK